MWHRYIFLFLFGSFRVTLASMSVTSHFSNRYINGKLVPPFDNIKYINFKYNVLMKKKWLTPFYFVNCFTFLIHIIFSEQYKNLRYLLTKFCRKDCFIWDFSLNVCGDNINILWGTVFVFLSFVIIPQKLPAKICSLH